jgi:hypothetical protein
MALMTFVGKIPEYVIWIRRLFELSLMALVTIDKLQLEISVHMTRLAGDCCMCTSEREMSHGVIKRRGTPTLR